MIDQRKAYDERVEELSKDSAEGRDRSITGRLATLERNQPNYRIEALRAAAALQQQLTKRLADTGTSGLLPMKVLGDDTLALAERFVSWLETGRRDA